MSKISKRLDPRNSKKHVRLSKAQKVAITKKILALYEGGEHTLSSCAESEGVDPARFFLWKTPYAGNRGFVQEVLDLFNASKERRDITFRSKLKDSARAGLLKLVRGQEVEEVTQDYENYVNDDGELTCRIKSERRTIKVIQPNPTAVMFALKNLDAENFKDVYTSNLNVSNENKMTNEQLADEIEQLERELKAKAKGK